MSDQQRYWFPAKRYGWGWGFPVIWQGWVVMLVYFVALGLTVSLLSTQILLLSGLVALESGLMILVCYLKGEPPGWHWSDRSK